MKKQLHLLLALMFVHLISAQMPNDCVNAISVCGNGIFSTDVATGVGTVQEISSCGGAEHNSLWLKIFIAQSGTLGFTLKPKNATIAVDYDFWVYGPNKAPVNLGAPLRCCTTNPAAAGLSNNYTGMKGTSILTSSGPGSSGDGFVYWLNVSAGESYYIAIDGSQGQGGFDIEWNGTAALLSAPIANSVPDYITCSNTPYVGVFNLNSIRPSVNSDLMSNTVSFYNSFADAQAQINPLPNLVANVSNPQFVYARVTNMASSCFSLTSFNLIVKSCKTKVLDTKFEQALISLGYDSVIDGEVDNWSISGITTLDISNKGISDLTGIESFTSLLSLNCSKNNLVGLKLPNSLQTLDCSSNNLTNLDISKLTAMQNFDCRTNANLSCIAVNDVTAANSKINWLKDATASYATVCSSLAVENPALTAFSAKVYPNPFNAFFVLDINALGQEPIKIKVYDMLGRIVEQMEGNPTDIAKQRFGQNYASGIYNIEVGQGEQVKTLRIIKE